MAVFSAYHGKLKKARKVGKKAQKTLGSAVRCESGWRQMRQPFLPLKIDPVDFAHFTAYVRTWGIRWLLPYDSAYICGCTWGILDCIECSHFYLQRISTQVSLHTVYLSSYETSHIWTKKAVFCRQKLATSPVLWLGGVVPPRRF